MLLVNGTCAKPPSFVIVPGITGTWVDEIGTSGFGIEVLDGGQMVVEWYTFAPEGGQAYVGGAGPYSGNQAAMTLFQMVGPGAAFPPRYDERNVHPAEWGSVELTFTDCNNGRIAWTSLVSGFGTGDMAIKRLTKPAGLSCP